MRYAVVVCAPDDPYERYPDREHKVYGPFGCEDAARQFIKNDLDECGAEAVPLIGQEVCQ